VIELGGFVFLVHEKKQKDGKWEVAWMWLPHFLATDVNLHKMVDRRMTEEFKGQMVKEGTTHHLEQMHKKVIDLILEQYPILGLRGLLESYAQLDPEQRL
jgi:hypothetical protein